MPLPEIDTAQHEWVAMTMHPVTVLRDDNGEPVIFADPDDIREADDTAVYGCNRCSVPLHSVEAQLPCVPEDGDN